MFMEWLYDALRLALYLGITFSAIVMLTAVAINRNRDRDIDP